MNIHEIEIKTTAGIEKVDFDKAKYLRDIDAINFDHYLEKLMDTRWANAIITFHKGCEGTYQECKDGSVYWSSEDVEWFETQILGL